MKIIGVVQARMSSSRLPNKVIARIEGQPMVWHIVERLRCSKLLQSVALAVPNAPSDDTLRKIAQSKGIPLYAGSEVDVLDRLLEASNKFQADAIVRITGDCPLVDPAIVDLIIWAYLSVEGLDYVSNTRPPTYPAGLSVELFPITTLQRLWHEIKDPVYREWFPVYLWEREEQFCTRNIKHDENLSHLRWTVDYEEDLAFVRAVYRHLGSRGFGLYDVLALLEEKPKIARINAKHVIDPLYKFPYKGDQ